MAEALGDGSGASADAETQRLVERAIESVLEQVPEAPDSDIPESGGKVQPWAETAAPPGKNKRPLEELLEEYTVRLAADPDAVAASPGLQHPAAAFFERFARTGRSPSSRSRQRRRLRQGQSAEASPPQQRTGPRRARRRRGGRRRSQHGP